MINFIFRQKNINLLMFFLIIVFLKIFVFILIKNEFLIIDLGGGNDSNLYDGIATGKMYGEPNSWPLLLKFFNDFGLYNRILFSSFLLVISIYFLPKAISVLSGISWKNDQKELLIIFLIVGISPTLFFYATNVYRDIYMAFVFVLALFPVKYLISSNKFGAKFISFLLFLFFSYYLYSLRPYLGLAYFLSFPFVFIQLTKKRLYWVSFFALITLYFLNAYGFLSELMDYRAEFSDNGLNSGGSNLNIDFSNPILFIPNVILSILGQNFGLFFPNFMSIIIFILESLIHFLMLIYIFKNYRFFNHFIGFLLMFYLTYMLVWCIGNGNLGTAVRLRIFNYIVVYIIFFTIYMIKKKRVDYV